MVVDHSEKFITQIEALRDESLLKRVRKVISSVETASDMREIPCLKKLKGHRTAHRIRIGNYRLCLYIENEVVEFVLFDHRKQVYRDWPK